jgi:hypothetical protein
MLTLSFSPFRPLSSYSSLSISSSSLSQVVAVAEQGQQQKPQLRSSQLVALEYADLNLSYNLVCFFMSFLLSFSTLNDNIMNLCFFLTNYIIIMFYVKFQNLGHGRIRQHVNPSSFSVCSFLYYTNSNVFSYSL